MRDPFRPNSNSQLMREAQFAFVVIVLLLGVLVYVTIHRVSGRKLRFRQIAQTAPVAQHIGENAYPAQTVIDHEERFSQDVLPAPQSVAGPVPKKENRTSPTTERTSTKTVSPRQQPTVLAAPAIKTQPPATRNSAAAALVATTERVAQAQFIELSKTKPETNFTPKRHRAISKPTVDDPFEKINGPSSTAVGSLAFAARGRNQDFDRSKKPVPPSPVLNKAANDSTAAFDPPPIKSDFGAGSTRELPSFDTPAKKEPAKETASFNVAPISPTPTEPTPTEPTPTEPTPTEPSPTPVLTPLKQTQQQSSAFVPQQKAVAPLAKPSSAKTFSAQTFSAQNFNTQGTTEAKVVIEQPPKKQTSTMQTSTTRIPETQPQPTGHREYRVQTTDSLWSIALDHYGDGRFFRALHEHNIDRITSADRLEPNTTLLIPEVDQLIERYADLCPAEKLGAGDLSTEDDPDDELPEVDYARYEQNMEERFHITQSGDTLFDVARKRLGQASRYLEIFELNRFRIPQHANHLTPLNPGLRLLLPE